MTRKEKAAEFKNHGNNCAVSVGCAYCDKAGVPEREMKELVTRYRGGAYKYCGAILGAVAAMNMAKGDFDKNDPAKLNGAAADEARALMDEFKARNGSVYCRELKGRNTGVPLRSCLGCVEDAAELAEKHFK